MPNERLVAVVEFAGPVTLDDVEDMRRWFAEAADVRAELDLSEGHIRLWRPADRGDDAE